MLILIADDERLARFTLKSMLSSILSQPYTVAEAQDGKVFIEQCRTLRPDIAFVDINMPQLDGISAIEQCRAELPLTRFVITTGYSDFAYAQKCISLGVTEYLLKPLEEEKLAELLERLLELNATDCETSNAAFQVRMIHYFQAMDEIGSGDAPEQDADCSDLLFEFFIDGAQRPDIYAACYQALRKGLTAAAEKLLPDGVRYALFHSPNGNLRIAMHCSPAQQERVELSIDRICSAQSSPHMLVSALWVQSNQPSALHKSAVAMSTAAWCRFGNPPARAHCFFGTEDSDFLQTLGAAFDGFLAADEVTYTRAARKLSGTAPANEQQFASALAYVRAITGCTDDAADAKHLSAALLRLVPQIYRTAPQDGEVDKIEQIKAYIEANYSSDISINLLADRFFLTPNYLSRLFHEKAGVRFVDYLTEVRIANAKRILTQNPTALVKDIAIMVGYFSARHFSATFKRETGLYPAEFRAANI